jgi:hypothetical protein
MRFLLIAAIVTAVLWMAGCVHRTAVAKVYTKPPGKRNYFVGKNCHASAELMNCDESSPPKCQFERVKFDRGCEQLEVKP